MAEYVNNKELYKEFVLYHDSKLKALENDQRIPPLTNKIGEAILQVCTRSAYSKKFYGYTPVWKQEMIADAIEICIRYAHNFNPAKSKNPFAYITQLAKNAMIQRIKREKKQLYTRYKLYAETNGFSADYDENFNIEDVEAVNEVNVVFLDHLVYIHDYETKAKEAKEAKMVEKKSKDMVSLKDVFDV